VLAEVGDANSNETIIFSFTTLKSQKKLFISMAKDESYIVYRYCKKGKVEFEFPKNKTNAYDAFRYSFYFRGNGYQNAGLDLNSLYFHNGHYQYRVYDDRSYENESKSAKPHPNAEQQARHIGIEITNLKTKRVFDIQGDIQTVQGTLVDLKWVKHIKRQDF